MAKRESTPNRRASETKKDVTRVRRRYKKNTNRQARILPGEIIHVQSMVAVLHIAHYTKQQIARIIGISRGQVREFMEAPEVNELIVKMRAELPAAALELMEGYQIEAVQAIVDVMRVSEDDSQVLKAASEILDRTGLPKVSKQEQYRTNEEKTTFTDDGIVEALREASPEVQEEAARIIEKLEELLNKNAAEAEANDENS